MQSAKAINEEIATPLSKSSSFVLLWVATLISSLSMSMFMFIQSWYVVEDLGLEAALGIVLVCLTSSRMVSMVIGGVLADRSKQSKIIFLSDACRAVLALGLAILFNLLSEVPIWALAVNAAFFGVLGGLFEPARDSLLPKVVQTEQLTRANSAIQGAIQVALFSGPLFAGIMLSLVSYSFLLVIISVCLFLAGTGVLFIKVAKDLTTEEKQGKVSFKNQLKEGINYAWGTPLLRALIIITIIVNFFLSGPLMMGLPIFVEGVLNGSSIDFSLVQGGFTFGMIIGSVVIGMINLKRKRGAYALYFIAIQGFGMLVFSQSQSLGASVSIIVFLGMLTPSVNIPLISLVQAYSEKAKVGRVMSLIRTGSLGLIPLSYTVTSFILGFGVPIQTIMAWSSFPLIISVSILYFVFPILKRVD